MVVRLQNPTARSALVVALVLVTSACGSPDAGPEPTAETGAVVDAVGSGTGDGATDGDTVADAPPVDLARFETIDLAGWAAIAADPEAATGRQVVVFTVVAQVFSSTGPGTFQGQVATSQPASATEGTGALLHAEPTLVEDVAVGDVLLVHAEVTGAFGGSSGTANVTPELTVLAVEDVGFRDLLADVVLGAATRTGAGVMVPVTVTNSSDRTMDYLVDLVAQSPDDSRQLAAESVRLTFVAPGQTAVVEAKFPLNVTRDAVISVAAVERFVTE